MNFDQLLLWHKTHKEQNLYGRYITHHSIAPLLDFWRNNYEITEIGKSVLGKSIHSIQIGSGPKKILMWSQMHGNESTTTKALFDLFKWLTASEYKIEAESLLKSCTLLIIPILNPDGAERYTRLNAHDIDLNRDAQNQSQPESIILRTVFDAFKPDFCLNLHGQRTIFGVGDPAKSATVSFLSPAQDKNRSVTRSRKMGMAIIAGLNEMLQHFIPQGVGRYDDSFNLNCVGDTFQSLNVPTVLFEAGHYPDDYAREETRAYIFLALVKALNIITNSNDDLKRGYKGYFEIPENKKCFFDIILRQIALPEAGVTDVAIQYEETLIEGELRFIPKIAEIAVLQEFTGHVEYDCDSQNPDITDTNIWQKGSKIGQITLNNGFTKTFSQILPKTL
tara:strand:+ start:109527 stop:110702 length:1176 start_codon:yes stop_codon:yes gene_type:complete